MNGKTKYIKFLLILAIAITVIGFMFDLRSTFTYPGTDLRNRVVGARLALKGIDPYFFKWHPGLPKTFYDPMDRAEDILTKLSVPPSVLALHAPIAQLSYKSQKVIWLIVQWATFLGILSIFYQSNESRNRRNLVLLLGFFFANSLFWRFHVNSGQIYVVYIGLLSVSWFLLNQQFKYKEVAGGFFAGITAGLRPPYVLLLFYFLIHRRYSFVVGGVAGILFAVFSSLSVFSSFIWRRYILTMMGMTGFVNLQQLFPKLRESIVSQAIAYPQVVEGVDYRIRNPLEGYEGEFISNSALFGVFTALDLSQKKEILVISFLIIFIALCWFSFKYSIKQKDLNLIFLFSTVACLISEFFIPVGRYSYYDIQLLLPLLIIFSTADIPELFHSKLIWLLIAGFIVSIGGYFTWIPHALFFSTYLIMGYITLTTLDLIIQKTRKPKNIAAHNLS